MKILVLGGTGAMGVPLVEHLGQIKQQEVFVTSRAPQRSKENIVYFQGDPHDGPFLTKILEQKYDAIFDFMVWSFEEYKKILPRFLNSTEQYFFFSSSRVYADSDNCFITEKSGRLLDTINDKDYLSTDEYALTKAREENVLFKNASRNWTIIRPYITYNSQRLQLGVYEKEHWLYRALKDKTLVFPRDIAEKQTSLTYAPDVIKAIIPLVGNQRALGEAFHVVTKESVTWQQVLDIYSEIIEEETGKKIKVYQPDNSEELKKIWPSSAQIQYDRLFNRRFDSTKILEVVGNIEYLTVREGLGKCLQEFLKNPRWRDLNIRYEAWSDRITGERTALSEIKGKRAKLIYLKQRYM